MSFMVSAFMSGKMVGCTLANGRMETCMALANTSGKITSNMKVNMLMTRSTGTEFTLGLMDAYTKDTGRMANSTVLLSTN